MHYALVVGLGASAAQPLAPCATTCLCHLAVSAQTYKQRSSHPHKRSQRKSCSAGLHERPQLMYHFRRLFLSDAVAGSFDDRQRRPLHETSNLACLCCRPQHVTSKTHGGMRVLTYGTDPVVLSRHDQRGRLDLVQPRSVVKVLLGVGVEVICENQCVASSCSSCSSSLDSSDAVLTMYARSVHPPPGGLEPLVGIVYALCVQRPHGEHDQWHLVIVDERAKDLVQHGRGGERRSREAGDEDLARFFFV